jgi:hypothetical protein
MGFPREHRAKLHSTNPIERLNGEIKRRTDVVSIFPNDAAVIRLVDALLLEQSDEWASQRSRYMTLVWDVSRQPDSPIRTSSRDKRSQRRDPNRRRARLQHAHCALRPCIRWAH